MSKVHLSVSSNYGDNRSMYQAFTETTLYSTWCITLWSKVKVYKLPSVFTGKIMEMKKGDTDNQKKNPSISQIFLNLMSLKSHQLSWSLMLWGHWPYTQTNR